MKKVDVWKTSDGKIFTCSVEAEKHENMEKIKRIFKQLLDEHQWDPISMQDLCLIIDKYEDKIYNQIEKIIKK